MASASLGPLRRAVGDGDSRSSLRGHRIGLVLLLDLPGGGFGIEPAARPNVRIPQRKLDSCPVLDFRRNTFAFHNESAFLLPRPLSRRSNHFAAESDIRLLPAP